MLRLFVDMIGVLNVVYFYVIKGFFVFEVGVMFVVKIIFFNFWVFVSCFYFVCGDVF